jgi:hypothetical protein
MNRNKNQKEIIKKVTIIKVKLIEIVSSDNLIIKPIQTVRI